MCVYEHKWLSLEYKASDLLSYLMGWGGGSQDFHKEFTVLIAFLKDKKRISQQKLFTLLIETIKK